ncbi:atilla isoform b-related-related [Holotrichia oblita]|uniref:Atilla isoform b-related-related n=1 Tax=Holotrichia oblita TaxID=644536 RepID=A0ACB9SLT4_HOLOL|nr:atilla isoform b-related-related [Holotrichia oblita]
MKYNIHLICLSTVLIVLLFVENGFAIRCYQCTTDTDPKCADPFDNRTVGLTECLPKELGQDSAVVIPKMCRKIRQKVQGSWRYIRGCGFLGEVGIQGDERFCLMRTGTYNIFMEYCSCNSRDGCNSSDISKVSSVLFGTIFLISLSKVLHWLYFDGLAVRCYQCGSDHDKKGEDNCGAYKTFDKSRHIAVECNSDESHMPGSFCVKIVQQGPKGFIWDGRWRQVIRRCASVANTGVTGVCNWGVFENGVFWQECYCSEDECNSSNVQTISITLLLSAIFLTFKLFF